jgi:thiol-disulfide isomerase/thioredoxin
MMTLQLGPLALPTAPLIAIASLWIGLMVARRLAPTVAAAIERELWWALAVAALVARIGMIAIEPAYWRLDPLLWLNLADGGFLIPAGVAAGLLWMAWRLARPVPASRRALGIGLLVTGCVWSSLSLATGQFSRPPVPSLSFSTLEGRSVRLDQLAQGRPTVINLWASWCPPCRRELPAFADAQMQHPEIRFIFVDVGEDAATVRRFLSSQQLVLEHVLLDPQSRLSDVVGSTALPTTLFYDARGTLVERRLGGLSEASLASRLKLLDEARP